MGVTRAQPAEDAIVGIVGGELGWAGTKVGALFHGVEDEGDGEARLTFQGPEVGPRVVFQPEAWLVPFGFGPREGNGMVAREGCHPRWVILRSLAQRRLGNGVDAVQVAKKIEDGLRTGEPREIARDDAALETVVYKNQQAGEPLVESFDRPSSPA